MYFWIRIGKELELVGKYIHVHCQALYRKFRPVYCLSVRLHVP